MSGNESAPVVLLDLDDTLVDRQGAFLAWLRAFVDRWSLDDAAARTLLDLDHHGETPRAALMELARERFGVPEPLDRLLAAYAMDMPTHMRPLPGVPNGLRALRAKGCVIGVITNGASDPQRRKVQVAGLTALIDALVISEEVGLRKPDPAIFALARRRLNVAEDAPGWMVGDLRHTDVAGGLAAGLRTVWVPLDGGDPSPSVEGVSDQAPEPEFRCGSTAEALTLIGDTLP